MTVMCLISVSKGILHFASAARGFHMPLKIPPQCSSASSGSIIAGDEAHGTFLYA